MDNGLIFPYPRKNAHAERGNAKRPNLRCGPSGLCVGERVTRTFSRQAMG